MKSLLLPAPDKLTPSAEPRWADNPAVMPDELLRERLLPSELARKAGGPNPWLWHGYLGPGKLTLLTSQWKAGKTTLVSLLLARMATGGVLAGLPVSAGRAAVVSEESPADWDKRCRKLHLGDHVSLFCRPFRARPTPAQWQALLKALLRLRAREGLDLVVIDPLAVFLPGSESTAAVMLEGLLPLQQLTAVGLGVLLLHHPRKGVTLPGQAARGSGALPGHADILIEMHWYGRADEEDRRRWLRAYSRHEETRRHLLLELTAGGDDYLAHEPPLDDASAESGRVLRMVLEDATERLTQRQIVEQWPEDFKKPDTTTVSRALRRGMERGHILQRGTGRRNDPYRYWLPEKESDLHPGPRASAEELERWQKRWTDKLLGYFDPTPGASGEGPTTDSAAAGGEAPDNPAPVSVEGKPGLPGIESNALAESVAPPAAVDVLLRTPALTAEALGSAAPAEARRAAPPASPAGPVIATTPASPAAVAKPASAPDPAEALARERRRLRRWPWG